MTQAEATISVVMPVYNGARFLAEALQSVLAQTYMPHEIIIIDDGSTDNSGDIIGQVAADSVVPIRYLRQENQGTSAARNQGIEIAAGHLIAFLDQDDLWLAHKLARQCDLLRRRPAVGYSITQVELLMDSNGPVPAWVRSKRLEGPQTGYLPSCLLVRRSLFQQVGVFDQALRNGSDTDWFARVQDAEIEIAVVPEVLVRYRVHSGNQSQFVRENNKELCVVARKALLRKRLLSAI